MLHDPLCPGPLLRALWPLPKTCLLQHPLHGELPTRQGPEYPEPADLRTWQDGHGDADGSAVLDELEEDVNVVEQLGDDQLTASLDLAPGSRGKKEQRVSIADCLPITPNQGAGGQGEGGGAVPPSHLHTQRQTAPPRLPFRPSAPPVHSHAPPSASGTRC